MKFSSAHFPARFSVFIAALAFAVFVLAGAASAQPPTQSKAPSKVQAKSPSTASSKANPQAPPQPANPVAQHHRAAQTFQLANDFDHAAAEYRQAISAALEQLASLAAARSQYADAAELFERAVEVDRSSVALKTGLALMMFQSGELAKAKDATRAVLAEAPDDPRAQNLLGRIEMEEGNYAAAAEHLRAAYDKSPDFDTAYSLALACLKQQKLEQAFPIFDEMLGTLGSTAELHVVIGWAYRETGYYEQAVSEFKKALALDGRHPRAHSYVGLVYLRQGGSTKFSEARQEFEAELKINPEDYSSHYYLGIIELNLHNLKAAEAELSKASRIMPESADPYCFLGQAYLEDGQAELAAAALRKSIALTKDISANNYQVARAHYMLGQALLKTGKQADGEAEIALSQQIRAEQAKHTTDDSAQAAVNKIAGLEASHADLARQNIAAALKPAKTTAADESAAEQYRRQLAPILGDSYNNLGVIYAQRQDYAQAAALFEQAARWDPAIPALDKNRALASFRANLYAQAAPSLARLLERNRNDIEARQMLGVSYFMTDQFGKAVEVFRPILAEPPANPGVVYAMAVSLIRAGKGAVDAAASEKLLMTMIEKDPNVPEVHMILGQAYAQQQDYASARREFARALELNPKLPEAHYQTGLTFVLEGKLLDAEQQFRQELELTPQGTPAKFQLASVLLGQGKQPEGITLLNEVIQQKPDDADAYYQLGKALLEQGQTTEALEKLEAAVRLQPDNELGYYQMGLAYRKLGRGQEAEAAIRKYQTLKQEKDAKTKERLQQQMKEKGRDEGAPEKPPE
jgi:tetratricopeptide (TPR) repeat protein